MKKLLVVSIISLTLVASSQIFAGCYEAGRFVSCPACSDCGSKNVTVCQCTDQGVIRNNTCMTTAKYCDAFGNVGAR